MALRSHTGAGGVDGKGQSQGGTLSETEGRTTAGPTSWAAAAILIGYCVATAVLVGAFRAPLHSPGLLVIAGYALVPVLFSLAYLLGERTGGGAPDLLAVRPATYAMVALAAPLVVAWSGLGPLFGLTLHAGLCILLLALLRGRGAVRRYALPLLVLGMLIAPLCFILVNAAGYATVFAPEAAVAGLLHRDTLYLSSIASMFRLSWVPSTGLDGIPLTHYHTLSNIVLGTLASAARIDTISGYYLGMQLVLIPAAYSSVGVASRAIAGPGLSRSGNIATAVLPLAVLAILGVWDWNSYLASESHALGLAILLLGIPLLKSIAEAPGKTVTNGAILLGCLICFLAVAAKVSTGGIFVCGFLFVAIRSGRLSGRQYAILAGFVVVLGWLVLSFLLPTDHEAQSKIDLFHFVANFGSIAWINLATIFIGVLICGADWWAGRSRMWSETALVMMAVSVVATMMFQIEGGSAYYFLNVGTWIAIAIISAAVVRFAPDRYSSRIYLSGMAATLLFMAGGIQANGKHYEFANAVNKLYVTLGGNDGSLRGPFSFERKLQTIAENAPRSPLGRIAATIEAHRQGSTAPLVLLSANVWDAVPYACQTAPFFVPAYVGLPMLLGLRTNEADCAFIPYFSFPDYTEQHPPRADLTTPQICTAAHKRGFDRVIAVQTLDSAEEVVCPEGA